MAASVAFWWEDWGIKTDLRRVEMGGVEVEDVRLRILHPVPNSVVEGFVSVNSTTLVVWGAYLTTANG